MDLKSKKAPTRDERQEEIVQEFINLNAQAYVEACTGFGKTWIAFLILGRLKAKDKDATTIVVVPTLVLQRQWRDEVQRLQYTNVEVWVINSYIKHSHECDFLILDEGHRVTTATAKEFNTVLGRTTYKYVCPLSATFSDEEKAFMHSKGIGCAGVVTLEEARKNGWVNDFIVYNLPVDLKPHEQEEYTRWNDMFNNYFAKFGHDWNTAMSCMTIKPILKKYPGTESWACFEPDSVHWCKSMGWRGNDTQKAMENYFYNKNSKRGSPKLSVWGNDDHPWSPSNVTRYAAMWHRAMQQRTKTINMSQSKVEATVELIQRLQVKTITFSESTEFADTLTSIMPDISRSYHSNIPSQKRPYTKVTKYKTKPDKIEHKVKPVSPKAILQENKKLFVEDKILVMNTARALDEGADFKGMVLGIETSGSSNPRQKVQRTGRVIRKEEWKELSVYVRIYARGTHEEGKVKAQQRGMTGIIVVNNVNDISIGRPKSTFGSIINPGV